jgi:hypothetical protein
MTPPVPPPNRMVREGVGKFEYYFYPGLLLTLTVGFFWGPLMYAVGRVMARGWMMAAIRWAALAVVVAGFVGLGFFAVLGIFFFKAWGKGLRG